MRSFSRKKIIVISIGFLLLAVAIVFFKTASKTTIKENKKIEALSFNQTSDGSIYYITQEEVPFEKDGNSGTNNNLVLYKTSPTITSSTKIIEIVAVEEIQEIVWPNNDDGQLFVRLIKGYEDENIPEYAVYPEETYLVDIEKKEIKKIPNLVSGISWFNKNLSSYFTTEEISGEGKSINISKNNDYLDKKETISSSAANDLAEWIDENTLITSNSLDEFSPGNLYIEIVDLKTKEAKRITSSGNSAGASLSPDKKRFTYIELNPKTMVPAIFLGTIGSKKAINLKINNYTSAATWSADSKYLYIASPDEFKKDSSGQFTSAKNKIWRVDSETGKKKLVFDPERNKNINNFFITNIQIDKKSKRIYLIADNSALYTLTLPLISF